jgi:hypothetical protein
VVVVTVVLPPSSVSTAVMVALAAPLPLGSLPVPSMTIVRVSMFLVM